MWCSHLWCEAVVLQVQQLVRNLRVRTAQAFVLPGIGLLRLGTPDRPGQTEEQKPLLHGLTDCPRTSSVLQNE